MRTCICTCVFVYQRMCGCVLQRYDPARTIRTQ